MPSQGRINYIIGFNIDRSSYNQITNDMKKIQDQAKGLSPADRLNQGLIEAAKSASKLEQILNQSWNSKLNEVDPSKLSTGIRKAYGDLENFKKEMENIGFEGTNAYDQVTASIMNTNVQLTQSSKLLNSIADSFGKTIKWGIASAAMNSFRGAVQGAWGYVQHLDKSLNKIRVVSGESAANMEKFAKQANETASALGASTLDYTDAALIYYQQGLSTEEVAERTEATLKMVNATGLDAQTVSSQMTAIWNNFDDGTKTLEYFGDVLAKLGANTAASSAEIAEGLSKFSAIADTVGLSYEYATSALATVVATTRQSAEVVGTAFKTIFARMEDLKLGETLDDQTDLGKYSQALAAVGISIKDSNGELKEMDNILDEMGAKWDTLNKDQQVALAQTVAGIRQYSQLVALMDNWDIMKDNIQMAADATGTLNDQQSTYLDSMQAHFQKLSTQWQRTYDIIFNPDTANETVDVLTKLLEKFNDFIEGIGGGAKAIGYFALMFTNLFSNNIAASLQRVSNNVKAVVKNFRDARSKEWLSKTSPENLQGGVRFTNSQIGGAASEISGKALEKQAADESKILRLSHLLTEEQQQQLKNSAREAAILRQKAQQIDTLTRKQHEQTMSIVKTSEVYDKTKNTIEQIVKSKIEASENTMNEMEAQQEILQELEQEFQKYNYINEIIKFELEQGYSQETIEATLPSLLKGDFEDFDSLRNRIAVVQENIHRLNLESDGTAANFRNAAREIDKANTKMENSVVSANRWSKAISALAGGLQAVVTIMGAIDTYQDKISEEGISKEEKRLAELEKNASIIQGTVGAAATTIGSIFGGPIGAMIANSIITPLTSIFTSLMTRAAKKAAKKAKQIAEQAAKDLEESLKKVEDLTAKQDTFSSTDVQKEWAVLVQGVDKYGNNLSLTNEEYNKYLQYCKEMAEIDDSLVSGYNAQGEAIITTVDAMNQMNDAIKEQIALEKQKQVQGEEYNKQLTDAKTEISTANTNLKNASTKAVSKRQEMIIAKTGDGKKSLTLEDLQYHLGSSTYGKIGQNYGTSDTEILQNISKIMEKYSIVSGETWKVIDSTEFAKRIDEIDTEIKKKEKEIQDKVKNLQQLSLNKILYEDTDFYKSLSNTSINLITNFNKNLQADLVGKSDEEIDKIQKDFEEKTKGFADFIKDQTPEMQALFEKMFTMDFDTQEEYKEAKEQIRLILKELDNSELKKEIAVDIGIGKYHDDNILYLEDQIDEYRSIIESAYSNVKLKAPNLDDFSVQELQKYSEYLEKIKGKVDENTHKMFQYNKAVQEASQSINTINLRMEVAGTALSEFSKDGKIGETTLQQLEAQYIELADIADKTSHEYIARLGELRENDEEAKMDALNSQLDNLNKAAQEYENKLDDLFEQQENWKILKDQKKVDEIEIDIVANLDQYKAVMDDIINTRYQIQIAIEADLKTDVENAFGLAEELDKLKSYVTEDLIVSLEDAKKIIDAGYAEMFENATTTADGKILLDKKVRDSAIDTAQSQIEADKEAKITQLKTQREVLDAQRKILTAKLGYINTALESQDEAEIESALNSIKLEDKKYQAEQNLMVDLLKDKEKYKEEELDINEELFISLGGMQEADSENQQKLSNDVQKTNDKNNKREFEGLKRISQLWDNISHQKVAYSENEIYEVTKVDWAEQKDSDGIVKSLLKKVEKGLKESDIGKVYEEIFKNASGKVLEDTSKKLEDQKSQLRDTLVALRKQTEEQISLLDDQIGEIDLSIAAMNSSTVALDKLQETVNEATKESIDLLEDEIDRYHDVNLALKEIEIELKRLQDIQKNLSGQDLTNNLQKQLDLLATQVDLNKQKLEIARKEAKERQSNLVSQGVQFDQNGLITNYWAALQSKMNYVNNLTMQYNSMSEEEQKEFKSTLDKANKDYEAFKKAISDYETLISDTIPGIEDTIQSTLDKEIEIKISQFNASVDLRLNTAKAEKDFIAFKNKIVKKLDDKDFLGKAASQLGEYGLYYNPAGTGTVQAATQQVQRLLAELKQMDKTGSSSTYGTNRKQLLEDLQKYQQTLMTQLTDVNSLVENIKKDYLSMIDEATSKFKEHVSQYQYINDLLKHDLNMIGLLYGDKAYNEMSQYYNKIAENNKQRIDFLSKEAAYFKEMMDASINEEEKQKWLKSWQDAQKELNSAVEDSLKNIQDKFKNAISDIFKEWEKELTGGSDFAWMEESWRMVKSKDEAFLDDINREYATRAFERSAKEALNNNTSAKAQSQITKIMNEQLAILREKDKLTKYDVDRANKILDITQKQIALEDAKNNKSQMRLRRDSQGNYSYQFVADEEEISKAEEELAKAQNDLYNFDKDAIKSNYEDAFKLLKEYEEKIIALYKDPNINPEEKEKRKTELYKYYEEMITAKIGENESIRVNLAESAFMSIKDFQDRELQSFLNMTDAEKQQFLSDFVPGINSGMQAMMDKIAGAGGFEEVCKESFAHLEEAANDYQADIKELEKVSGTSFDNIKNGIDSVVDETKEMMSTNDELLNQYKLQVEGVKKVVAQLDNMETSYRNNQQAAINAAEAAQNYWTKASEAATKVSELRDGISNAKSDYEGLIGVIKVAQQEAQNVTSPSGVGDSSTSGNSLDTTTPSAVDNGIEIGTKKKTYFYLDAKHVSNARPLDQNQASVEQGTVMTLTDYHEGDRYPYHVEFKDAKGRLKNGWVSMFNTGGYTGNWNSSEGRMAILHEKELVLNKDDTKNLLESVNLIRSYQNTLFGSMANRISSLLSGLNKANMQANTIPLASTEPSNLDQNVYIHAEFPGVQDAIEIKQALENLVNVATHRAGYGTW